MADTGPTAERLRRIGVTNEVARLLTSSGLSEVLKRFVGDPAVKAVLHELLAAKSEADTARGLLMARVATTGALNTTEIPPGSIVDVDLNWWRDFFEDREDTPDPSRRTVTLRCVGQGILKVIGDYMPELKTPRRERLHIDTLVELGTVTIPPKGKAALETTLHHQESVAVRRGGDIIVLSATPRTGAGSSRLALSAVRIDDVQVLPPHPTSA